MGIILTTLNINTMKNYDVYTISASDKATFLGIFEASTPFSAMDNAKAAKNIGNLTMRAFVTGSERAEKFALENK